MGYATDFLKELNARKRNNFTHKDILTWTTANCSYSVFRDVKQLLAKDGYRLVEIWEEETNTKNEHKRFRRYWIEKVA